MEVDMPSQQQPSELRAYAITPLSPFSSHPPVFPVTVSAWHTDDTQTVARNLALKYPSYLTWQQKRYVLDERLSTKFPDDDDTVEIQNEDGEDDCGEDHESSVDHKSKYPVRGLWSTILFYMCESEPRTLLTVKIATCTPFQERAVRAAVVLQATATSDSARRALLPCLYAASLGPARLGKSDDYDESSSNNTLLFSLHPAAQMDLFNSSVTSQSRILQLYGGSPARCDWIQRASFDCNPDLEEQLDILCLAMLDSVQSVHASGFTHGDIKLENFLVHVPEKGADAQLLLCDFDACRAIGQRIEVKDNMGTSSFWAPERTQMAAVQGFYASMDSWTVAEDIWKLGLCFLSVVARELISLEGLKSDRQIVQAVSNSVVSNRRRWSKTWGDSWATQCQLSQAISACLRLAPHERSLEPMRKLLCIGGSHCSSDQRCLSSPCLVPVRS